jgi:uncharacterized OB-fold protein
MRAPAHPHLYGADSDEPALFGSRCAECGRTSFPELAIGCEACGAPEARLVRVELRGAGVLHSIAVVHVHHGEPETPFSVVEVRLDAGPLIRAMLAPDASGLTVGDSVAAKWVVTGLDGDGNEVVEPGFVGAPA